MSDVDVDSLERRIARFRTPRPGHRPFKLKPWEIRDIQHRVWLGIASMAEMGRRYKISSPTVKYHCMKDVNVAEFVLRRREDELEHPEVLDGI